MGMGMGIISTVFVPLYFLYSLIVAPGNKVAEVNIRVTLKIRDHQFHKIPLSSIYFKIFLLSNFINC